TVVETFNLRSTKSEADLGTAEDSQAESQDVIRCDTCMEAEAAQTCLTCMASFCEEHLRPHRENPTFRVHQLSEPVGDLSERICPDHHKLMELFCSQHCRPICSLCLQLSDLREKLGLLNGKIEKTETLMFQMNNTQSKLKDAATTRKDSIGSRVSADPGYVGSRRKNAQHEVDSELEIGQTKLQDHMKRLTVNTGKMTKARESINNLLSQSQTMAFLQASFNLPKAVKFDPHMPQRRTNAVHPMFTEQQAEAVSGPATKSTGSQPEDKVNKPPKQRRAPRVPQCGSSTHPASTHAF
ncbi:hypothetical protein KUCAC02_015861, partial [Chaenocephalus aceratus]